VDREIAAQKEDKADHAPTPAAKKAAAPPVHKTGFAAVVLPQPAVPVKAASTSLKPLMMLKPSTSSVMEEDFHQPTIRQLSSVHMITHEGDIIAEKLKQAGRLKLLAAEQESQVLVQAIKLEEAKQVAQRDLVRQQSLLNDEKDGIRL
jgi:hypothetical protein